MSLVFSAIVPHSPMLLESIGKEQAKEALKETQAALKKIEEELYLSNPDIIVVISPHEGLYEEAYVVNGHTTFTSSFADFGDLVTTSSWKGCPDIAAKLSHAGSMSDTTVRLVSKDVISYGTSVPLHMLTTQMPNVKVLPIGFSNMDPKSHMNFGELIKEVVMDANKRVAIIASGDLSHTLTEKSPAGFNRLGAQFDNELISLLETRNSVGLLQLNKEIVEASQECGYRSLLILIGIIKEMDYTFRRYSYEYPFGVGYLVGNFTF